MPTLRINDPNGQHYHRGQAEYLKHARARKSEHERTKGKCGIQKLNYCGGRGAGKTTIGIIDMCNVALVEAPQFRTFWSEPNFSDIDRILLPEMEAVVPRELWRVVNKPGGYRYIEWASGHRTDLISRFVGNSNKRPGLGANMVGGWHDELASGFDENKINDIENSIRAPGAPYYFVASQSTPLRNGYEAYCKDPAATTVHATSWENPHISADVLNTRAATMSPEQVEQELKGNFVALEGRIWSHFVEEPWPLGNIIENRSFQRNKPWYMGVDLGGAQCAIGIYQLVNQGRTMCLIEEWVPNRTSFEAILKEIIAEYCDGDPRTNQPQAVYLGHDVNTKDSIGGQSAGMILSQLGWHWTYPANRLGSKDLQRSHASSLLYQRKFAISCTRDDTGEYVINKQHHGERKSRGLMNVMRMDTYPDPKSKETFVKDKGQAGINAIEDDRDQWLYTLVCHYHPEQMDKSFYMGDGVAQQIRHTG
jgi:hypothetical protein